MKEGWGGLCPPNQVSVLSAPWWPQCCSEWTAPQFCREPRAPPTSSVVGAKAVFAGQTVEGIEGGRDGGKKEGMEGGREEEMEEGMKDAGMLGLQACTAQLQLYPHLPTLPGGGGSGCQAPVDGGGGDRQGTRDQEEAESRRMPVPGGGGAWLEGREDGAMDMNDVTSQLSVLPGPASL